VTPELLRTAARLADPALREEAARALASAFGAEVLLIFLRDAEVGALLSAPGFPQTLPDGRRWRAFLDQCVKEGEAKGSLPLRSADDLLPAVGYAAGESSVAVLLGTDAPAGDIAWFRDLMPLLEAALRAERTANIAEAGARLARETVRRGVTVSQALDRTRLQLEETLAIAAKANRAKSDFLATMSHELRTPLNAIGGYVELLRLGIHGPVTEEQLHALGRINKSQRHLLGMINNVLNLSRIEAGRVNYALTDVSLERAFAQLAPLIEPQLEAKNLSYEVCDPEQLPVVRADAEKLEQILLNLLSNAVSFTEPGGRVEVNATRRDAKPEYVFVRISDTGRGIPADKLEAIFEPFMQVDSSHSRTVEGTGLGLAISRDLARGMGGDIRARSTPGKGSVFTLMLCEARPLGAVSPTIPG